MGTALDAVIVDCTSDVGVREARALVNIPVVGAGEASLRLSQQQGDYLRLSADELTAGPLETIVRERPRVVLIGGTG
ncbi:MAG: hypothetical protein SFU83_20540 [Meiothermus sp.]|nr:hypothetical protein [Meiothermus sp.]